MDDLARYLLTLMKWFSSICAGIAFLSILSSYFIGSQIPGFANILFVSFVLAAIVVNIWFAKDHYQAD